MNSIDLIKQLLKRLKKFSWFILIVMILFGGFFYYVATRSITLYTSTATVFPMSNTSSENVSGSVGNLLGISDASKSFGGETAINILELANSRRTREAVAMQRIPSMNNKTISELLMEEHNRHVGFLKNDSIHIPSDSLSSINIAAGLLQQSFTAKISKNGILELHFTNSNPAIVREISYVYIDKLSRFYINLKKMKAQIDYEFAVKKADSLLSILNKLDKRAVQLDESTFFTDENLQRYSIPKINLSLEKQTVQSQYYYAVNNRESAAYRLQKETPIIESLDKPEPPYGVKQKSKFVYTFIGLVLGCFIGLFIVSWPVFRKFIAFEINKTVLRMSMQNSQLPQPQTEPLK